MMVYAPQRGEARMPLTTSGVRQGIMTTMLDKHFLMYTADVMNVYRKCAALHKHAKVDGFKTFSTPSTGVIAVLGTLHLCKHVTVYGVGETRMPGMPYQVGRTAGRALFRVDVGATR